LSRHTPFDHVVTYRTRRPGQRDLFSGQSDLILHEVANAHTRIERLYLGPISFGRVRSTGHDVDLSEHLGVTLIVPVTGQLTSETRQGTYTASPHQALLFSPNRRRTRVEANIDPIFTGIPIIVPVREMEAAAGRLGVSSRRIGDPNLFSIVLDKTRSEPSSELIDLVGIILSEANRNSARLAHASAREDWGRIVAEKLVEVLGEAEILRLPPADFGSVAHRRVRRAVDYMRAHYGDIVGIREVAVAAGVSVRSLEQAFKQVMECSPYAYLGLVRLEEARRMLMEAKGERRVTEIACDCGISHLGRFAAAYRERYGESPSATAREER
jgi:AraC-like DNA-binding protein